MVQESCIHITYINVNCITTGDTFTNTYTYPRGTSRVPPLVESLWYCDIDWLKSGLQSLLYYARARVIILSRARQPTLHLLHLYIMQLACVADHPPQNNPLQMKSLSPSVFTRQKKKNPFARVLSFGADDLQLSLKINYRIHLHWYVMIFFNLILAGCDSISAIGGSITWLKQRHRHEQHCGSSMKNSLSGWTWSPSLSWC